MPTALSEYKEKNGVWLKSGLKTNIDHFEIIENGILTTRDRNILFRHLDVLEHLPVNSTRNINMYSDVRIDARLLVLLKEHDITLTLFDRYGNYVGRFSNEHSSANSLIFLKQCSAYNDSAKRLQIARSFVLAEIFNMRANLRYYSRSSRMPLDASILLLNDLYDKCNLCDKYEKLLLIEARARTVYYSCFDSITNNRNFIFERRSRMPPQNNINALISFGNVVLYNLIANDIHKTQLDVKIGFLHATGRRMQSLNLDIAEIFKPIIVDRVIFSLIRKRQLTGAEFLAKKGGIYLSPDGKRIFLKYFYQKLNSTITIDDEIINYDGLIWREIRSFQKSISDGSIYFPLHFRI